MVEKVKGIVQENPVTLERCCLFALEDDGGIYFVVSTDRQASKDSIFVAKEQEMHIKGSLLENVKFKGVMLTEMAQIKIK